jgi:hypothetical protein
MALLNCWEFKKCGREPGGEKADELGVCPAAVDDKYEGFNRGEKCGRACWLVQGTLCEIKFKGKRHQKQFECYRPSFFWKFNTPCVFCPAFKAR